MALPAAKAPAAPVVAKVAAPRRFTGWDILMVPPALALPWMVMFPFAFTTFALVMESSPKAVEAPITLRDTLPDVPASRVSVSAAVPRVSALMLPREITAPAGTTPAFVVSIWTPALRDALPVQLTAPPEVVIFARVEISDTAE
jgi:hypothetical protein